MSPNLIQSIEDWFHSHEDGAFGVQPASCASMRVGQSSDATTIIYTTKQHCLPRITGGVDPQQAVAKIARYGLPIHDDLPFIHGSSPAVNRVFIGDADPPDILVYFWLRAHLPIKWHGVNDDFLVRHGNRHNERIPIRISNSERETVPHLSRLCPGFRVFLGDYCSSLLDEGFKIELEGAII